MTTLRIVPDTNVLVSGLAYPGSTPGRILAAWQQGALAVVLSQYILDELVRVLPRLPRVSLSPAQIRDLADSLMFQVDMVEPDEVLFDEDLRDPADQPVLQTLLASEAQYLVTGDKDLLALAGRYAIVPWGVALSGLILRGFTFPPGVPVMLQEAIFTPERRHSSRSQADSYQDWLQRKVESARVSMQRGEGIPNEQVEAEFAARRQAAMAEGEPV